MLHIIGFAPRHEIIATKAAVGVNDDDRCGPALADLANDASNLRDAAVSSIQAR